MACNLRSDPTGAADFLGTTGQRVSASVKGTTGVAVLTGAHYAGVKISVNPATFTIQSGDKLLDLLIDNTVAGDVTLLLCDDGTVLDRFHFDRNNPARLYDVRGL